MRVVIVRACGSTIMEHSLFVEVLRCDTVSRYCDKPAVLINCIGR